MKESFKVLTPATEQEEGICFGMMCNQLQPQQVPKHLFCCQTGGADPFCLQHTPKIGVAMHNSEVNLWPPPRTSLSRGEYRMEELGMNLFLVDGVKSACNRRTHVAFRE